MNTPISPGMDSWALWRRIRNSGPRSDKIWFLAERKTSDSTWPARVRELLQPIYVNNSSRYAVGRVADDDPTIEQLANEVHRLRGLDPIHPQLENALRSAGLIENGTRADVDQDGKGILVGFIDNGCAFAHPRFRDRHGNSRVKHLWDQRHPPHSAIGTAPSPPEGFVYGTEINTKLSGDIFPALDDSDGWHAFYESRGYPLRESGNGEMTATNWTHGTHVMDVAVGSKGQGEHPEGVAPGADIAFVQLPHSSWAAPHDVRGASIHHLLDGVNYIFSKAGSRPCVINISYSGRTGPHDGSSLLELAFDELLSVPNRAIVLSAGNAADKRAHFRVRVRAGQTSKMSWVLPENDTTANVAELWYDAAAAISVAIRGPRDETLSGTGVPVGQYQLIESQGKTVGAVVHPNSKDAKKSVLIGVDPLLSASSSGSNSTDHARTNGVWDLDIKNIGDVDTEVYAWIERDDFVEPSNESQSWFVGANDTPSKFTLGGFATGKLPIVVGALHAATNGLSVESYSARGPTTDARMKPDLCAVASSESEPEGLVLTEAVTSGRRPFNGTSAAAPVVTGTVALLLQLAADKGTDIGIKQLREVLEQTALDIPAAPDVAVGWGAVDAAAALAKLAEAL